MIQSEQIFATFDASSSSIKFHSISCMRVEERQKVPGYDDDDDDMLDVDYDKMTREILVRYQACYVKRERAASFGCF